MYLQLLAFLTSVAQQAAFTASCVDLIYPILKLYLKLNISENIQSLFLLWQKNSTPKHLNLLHAIIFLDYLTKKVVKKKWFVFQTIFYHINIFNLFIFRTPIETLYSKCVRTLVTILIAFCI